MPESSPQLIDQTIEVWQSRTDRHLSREDARQILSNTAGFFTVLQEWAHKERAASGSMVSTDGYAQSAVLREVNHE